MADPQKNRIKFLVLALVCLSLLASLLFVSFHYGLISFPQSEDKIAEEEEIIEEEGDTDEKDTKIEITGMWETVLMIQATAFGEDGNKILVEVSSDNEEIYTTERIDITEKITKFFSKEEGAASQISNPIYVGNGFVAYNYKGMIYVQNIPAGTPPTAVFSENITDSLTWKRLLPFLHGPYIVDGGNDGVIANTSGGFVFSVDFVWGCEGDSTEDKEYCDEMMSATRKFCQVEKIPGIWLYDLELKKARQIDSGDCNL